MFNKLEHRLVTKLKVIPKNCYGRLYHHDFNTDFNKTLNDHHPPVKDQISAKVTEFNYKAQIIQQRIKEVQKRVLSVRKHLTTLDNHPLNTKRK